MKNQVLQTSLPELFSFRHCAWFLDRNLDDCTHEVIAGKVRKLIELDGEKLLLEISADEKNMYMEILSGSTAFRGRVIAWVRDWFDMDRNLAPFYRLLQQDPELAPLLELKGLRMVGIPDFFEAISWGIIGQQINLAFAYKMKRRFTEKYGESLLYEEKRYYLFPRPEVVQHIAVDDLKAFQFSGRKAEYLVGVAKLFAAGTLSKEALLELNEEPLIFEKLMAIRGIGEWTAHYAMLKGLKAQNSIPYGDTGINTALFNLKGIEKKQNRIAVDAFFEKYEGWKSYLVFYLWQSLRTEARTWINDHSK